MNRLWRWFLARFRLDLKVVCEESAKIKSHFDYHDYPDDIICTPDHFFVMTCKRCGKKFCI